MTRTARTARTHYTHRWRLRRGDGRAQATFARTRSSITWGHSRAGATTPRPSPYEPLRLGLRHVVIDHRTHATARHDTHTRHDTHHRTRHTRGYSRQTHTRHTTHDTGVLVVFSASWQVYRLADGVGLGPAFKLPTPSAAASPLSHRIMGGGIGLGGESVSQFLRPRRTTTFFTPDHIICALPGNIRGTHARHDTTRHARYSCGHGQ